MVKVDHFVTEWGFPAVRWADRVVRFLGTKEHERWLWVHHDGEQLITSIFGKTGVVGRWDELASMDIGSSRDDLGAYELRLLQTGNFSWAEHRTLNAHFGRSGMRRIATTAHSMTEVRRLHEVLSEAFIEGRRNYEPPLEGVCWRGQFAPIHDKLHPGELANLAKLPLTALNVGAAESRKIKALSNPPFPLIQWWEPVATRGAMGLGLKYHRVARMLSVERGEGPGRYTLLFNGYKPGTEGVVVVKAEFALLKDFRVVDSKATYAKALQPIKGILPGLSNRGGFPVRAYPPAYLRDVSTGRRRMRGDRTAEGATAKALPAARRSIAE